MESARASMSMALLLEKFGVKGTEKGKIIMAKYKSIYFMCGFYMLVISLDRICVAAYHKLERNLRIQNREKLIYLSAKKLASIKTLFYSKC